MYKRPQFSVLHSRLREDRRFIQVILGPRQCGKTTLVRQVLEESDLPAHWASADSLSGEGRAWIGQQWDLGRLRARGAGGAVLVLDEVQKVTGWSSVVKSLWDEDTASKVPLKVVLLGSSALLVRAGLAEDLTGRFEVIPLMHWSFAEMREAFGWDVERHVYFGGYPGAAPLVEDRPRWSLYVRESLVETTLSRDVLKLTRVDKPALLQQLFRLGCQYSGQVLSYNKMLGQLQESGNTTTLAHYLDLLTGAGLVTGLSRFSGKPVRQRGSSPKLLVLNTALMSSFSHLSLEEARQSGEPWGRLVESAVGAHLVNGAAGTALEVFYWLDRGKEVDFVLRLGEVVVALEVKSGRARGTFPGIEAFSMAFHPKRSLIVGGDGVPLREFLGTPPTAWVE